MIHLTASNTKLNLLLNTTNKALAKVILDASKTELKELLKEGGDLRSIMDKVLKQTAGDNSANKALLQLVKNNPTLNNLGDTSTTIKQLIKALKSDKNPLPIEKVLKNTLIDIKDIKSVDIKPKLENSGVFLESKIKNIQNPLKELNTTLQDAKEILIQSKEPQVKSIIKDIEALLKSETIKKAVKADILQDIKQSPKALENVSKGVKTIVDALQKNISNADPVYTAKTKELVQKIEFAATQTQTKNTAQKSEPPPLMQKSDILAQKSMSIQNKSLAKEVSSNELQKALPTNEVKQKIQVAVPAQHILEAKSLKQNPLGVVAKTQVNMQTVLLDDKVLKLPIVKETLLALQSVLDKSLTLESKPLLRNLTVIIATLSSAKEVSSEVKQEIVKLIQDVKTLTQKADVVYSKDLLTLFSKLKNLSLSPNLNYDNKIKEMLSHDLKATLLQTIGELENSSNPNKNELIKQMDKLALQIDNYQLLSHLSNGTSVYLPINWEQLEGGNIDIKKDKDKFYCDIELELKEYGDVSLKLMLFEKNQINIHVYSQNQELKDLFQENLSILRAGLIGTQIIPREIRFHDALEKSKNMHYQEDDDFKMGFEVKG